MSFKVTNIDDVKIEQNQEQEVQQEAPAQETVNDATEAREVPEAPQETQSETSGTVQEQEQTEEQGVEEKPLFETSSVDFEEEKVETASAEFDEPSKIDLRTFIEENKDLITQYGQVSKDYSEVPAQDVIREHITQTHTNLTAEEIDTLMTDYQIDESTDNPADVVKKKIAIDKAQKEAMQYLDQKRDQFLQDLGQRNLVGSQNDQAQQAQQEAQQAAHENFINQTNEVFNSEFKGFDFKMSDTKKLDIKINNVEAIKTQQSDINNFIGKYFDTETGQPTDLAGYHKAIFVASNYEYMLQNAYSQGQSDALSAEEARSKNIDMNARQNHGESSAKKKTTWKLVN